MFKWLKKYTTSITIIQALVWPITGALAAWHYLSDAEEDVVFESEEQFQTAVGCEIDKQEGDPLHPICLELLKK